MHWIVFVFALTATQPELRIVPVDRCEINRVETSQYSGFTQIILWRWSETKNRFVVAEWQLLEHGWHRELRGVIRWRDKDGCIRRVRPIAFIETRGIDTELEDRELVPECDRWPYFERVSDELQE